MEMAEELLLEVRVCQQDLDQVAEWIAIDHGTTSHGFQEFASFSDFIGKPLQSTIALSSHWNTKLDLSLVLNTPQVIHATEIRQFHSKLKVAEKLLNIVLFLAMYKL